MHPLDAVRAMRECGNHVLVISHHRLEATLQSLSGAVADSVARIEKIAEVRYDRTLGKLVIASLQASNPPSWARLKSMSEPSDDRASFVTVRSEGLRFPASHADCPWAKPAIS